MLDINDMDLNEATFSVKNIYHPYKITHGGKANFDDLAESLKKQTTI